MVRTLIILSVVLVEISTATGQQMDRISKSVVFLEHSFVETFTDGRGTFEVWLKVPNTNLWLPKMQSIMATGFLVHRAGDMYLVTAKHVAITMGGFTENDKLITGLTTDIHANRAEMPLAALRGTNTAGWIHHDRVDVSVLQVRPAPTLSVLLQEHFLDPSFLEFGTNSPSRDVVLTILGFPLGKGCGEGLGEEFLPVSKRSRRGSGLLNGGAVFLLEDPSIQGYSGAPVFDLGDIFLSGGAIMAGQRPMSCVGVISETVGDNTGGKMAGVIPTKCVLELLKK